MNYLFPSFVWLVTSYVCSVFAHKHVSICSEYEHNLQEKTNPLSFLRRTIFFMRILRVDLSKDSYNIWVWRNKKATILKHATYNVWSIYSSSNHAIDTYLLYLVVLIMLVDRKQYNIIVEHSHLEKNEPFVWNTREDIIG